MVVELIAPALGGSIIAAFTLSPQRALNPYKQVLA